MIGRRLDVKTNFIANYKCPKIFIVDCDRSVFRRKDWCRTKNRMFYLRNKEFVLYMKVTRSTKIPMKFHFEYTCLSLWFYAKFSWCINCVWCKEKTLKMLDEIEGLYVLQEIYYTYLYILYIHKYNIYLDISILWKNKFHFYVKINWTD